jgi:bacillithiol biosynthesis cysteine-adding enzyme BshC
LPNNDFFAAVTRLMDETYFPGETFGQAFGKMMIRLLGRYGLILIDSENHELKKLASPVITMKLLEKGRMNQLILEQSEALQKENYDHQIKIRSELLNVFILKDNNRIPLTLLGEMMSGNGEKVVLEDEELLKLAQEHPERFSPKVAFRPIVQDFLFPTVVYVGGPSELAYFAQLKKVYQFFDIEMPIIWPRTSATLIDAKIQRHIQRTGIVYEDIFRDHQQVQREIITRNMPETQEKVFEQAKSKLQGYLNWLSQELSNLDPALASQSRTPFKKMEYQLQQIHQLSLNKLKSQDSSLINSWQKIQLLLFPKGKMQERVYNIIYFLSRYGFWLMDYLMENLDIETDDHQILEIPSSPEK